MKTPRNYTLRLRSQLAASAALAAPLARPAGVFVLPAPVSGFQAFMNKVHRLAGPRRR
jgi:hypothetical protein